MEKVGAGPTWKQNLKRKLAPRRVYESISALSASGRSGGTGQGSYQRASESKGEGSSQRALESKGEGSLERASAAGGKPVGGPPDAQQQSRQQRASVGLLSSSLGKPSAIVKARLEKAASTSMFSVSSSRSLRSSAAESEQQPQQQEAKQRVTPGRGVITAGSKTAKVVASIAGATRGLGSSRRGAPDQDGDGASVGGASAVSAVPSYDELDVLTQGWTLNEISCDTEAMAAFQRYIEVNFCEESLNFLRAVREYRGAQALWLGSVPAALEAQADVAAEAAATAATGGMTAVGKKTGGDANAASAVAAAVPPLAAEGEEEEAPIEADGEASSKRARRYGARSPCEISLARVLSAAAANTVLEANNSEAVAPAPAPAPAAPAPAPAPAPAAAAPATQAAAEPAAGANTSLPRNSSEGVVLERSLSRWTTLRSTKAAAGEQQKTKSMGWSALMRRAHTARSVLPVDGPTKDDEEKEEQEGESKPSKSPPRLTALLKFRHAAFMAIVSEYVVTGGRNEVNIGSRDRKGVLRYTNSHGFCLLSTEEQRAVFDAAAVEIHHMLESNWLTEFLQTEEFRQAVMKSSNSSPSTAEPPPPAGAGAAAAAAVAVSPPSGGSSASSSSAATIVAGPGPGCSDDARNHISTPLQGEGKLNSVGPDGHIFGSIEQNKSTIPIIASGKIVDEMHCWE